MSTLTKQHIDALYCIIGSMETQEEKSGPRFVTLAYDVSTPAQKLRRQAEEMERRDVALILARQALAILSTPPSVELMPAASVAKVREALLLAQRANLPECEREVIYAALALLPGAGEDKS